jgi:molybdopterin-biosynthesis enzyme MoeA-like protein
MAGIARGFGTEVIVEPRLEAVLRDYWGPTMPEANVRLAHVPKGCELVGDDERWPVVRYRNVFVLPGVPALFKRKFLSIKSLLGSATRAERRLYCLGDEGVLAPHLEVVVGEYGDVKIGSYPRFHETTFKVILTLEGSDEARVVAAFERLRGLLGALVVTLPDPA